MKTGMVLVSSCLVLFAACQQAARSSGTVQSPSAPSIADAKGGERPWKAQLQWTVIDVKWAGQPGAAKSRFEGRCSVESDYIVTAKFEGEATHAGRFTGQGAHCTQITWTPQGPGAVSYGDGRGTVTAADGSTLVLQWGNGRTGYDAAAGESWFEDDFSFHGGTGRFEGATGGGVEGGRFKDFAAVLSGTPAPMTMNGTIAYGNGK